MLRAKRTIDSPRLTDGWLASTTGGAHGVAHWFTDGHSACHRWISTPFDREADESDRRCSVCQQTAWWR